MDAARSDDDAGAGTSLELIDRCQNHVLPSSKLGRHYMLHDYADENRAAWALVVRG